MRKQIGATVLALAMACSLMAGCSSGSGETTAATTTEAAKEESKEEAKDEAKDTSAEAENAGSEEGSGKKYVIGLAMNTQTNPFFVDVKDGVQKAADEHGIELYITDAQDDPTIQMKDGKGKIVEIQGIMGTNVAQNRSQGFNEVMKDNPDMEIVACQVADFDRAKGMSVMENILQANPEIDGLYAANDEMLLGALEAMEAAGRTDEIVKIGCDAIDDTLDAMKAGKVDATIAEPPFFLGKAILNTAYDYLEGKQVEPYVILDNQLVTQDTVDSLVTKE